MPPKRLPRKKAAAPLEKYRAKRDFKRTPEPGAKVARKSGRSFVVQEHHARSHHFDFRLEMDGVLVSWAVPKGVPEDFVAKRLAVHVEDHPLEYGKFAGTIPKGNYGAGTVAIWDKGEWEPVGKSWKKDFAKGKMKFVLKGDRLEGTYVIFRMGEEPNWILRKLDEEPEESIPVTPEKENPGFVPPEVARVVTAVPPGNQWVHEIKFDGYRLIAVKSGKSLRLFTRSGLDWTDRFQSLVAPLKKITPKDFVLDGEAVVFDKKGRSRFGDLQAVLQGSTGEGIVFVAFDLLHFDGFNLRDLPLSERLIRLEKLVGKDGAVVRRSKVWPAAEGKSLFEQACKNGLEGIISKNANGRYVPDSRRDWVKSKCRARQEFLICGYTPPKSSLPAFSSLVLGSFENGKLVPRGKVGTGFSEKDRVSLLGTLKPLETRKVPFDFPEKNVSWITPKLVAEIEFAEITRDGSIRQGSFVALREDKPPAEVHLDGVQKAAKDVKSAKVAGITISHPDRMVYPADGVSKMEVAMYYERVAELMLPFVTKRPLAILRAPEGITGDLFFQKSFPNHVPEHVDQTDLEDGTKVISIKSAGGLVALAQFGTLELHPWGARLDDVDKPDSLIWDLDPDERVPWKEVLGAAFLLRDFLAGKGLQTQVKTSGGKGLHVMLYLKRNHAWEDLKPFAKAVAAGVAAHNPRRFTITASKAKRTGKIYIDWLRNGRGATCVAPWGLRARPGATVSMPLNWSQLPDLEARGFTIYEAPETPEEWKKIKRQSISLKLLREMLDA